MHTLLLLPLLASISATQEFYPVQNGTIGAGGDELGPAYEVNGRAVFPSSLSKSRGFEVFWNVPSFMCRSYKILFNDLPQQYGIVQNENDTFRGDKLVILYDPGKFPALLEHQKTKQIFRRNGGVPQEGDLQEHLNIFTEHINQLVDTEFAGIGVIDFESWRPIFRQNSGVLQPYRNLSIKLVRQEHRLWSKDRVYNEAKRRFETAGKQFVEATIRRAQQLRPKASWGYYGFPYCFNMNGGGANKDENCPSNVQKENDELGWLWDVVDIVLPSVYLNTRLEPYERPGFVRGRMREAYRVAQRARKRQKPPVVGYIRYVYTNQAKDFLSNDDMRKSIEVMKQQNAEGVVLWGSSFDLKTRDKCQAFRSYVDTSLGPMINSLRHNVAPTIFQPKIDYS